MRELLKNTLLILLSILIIIIAILITNIKKIVNTCENDNTIKYMSWCRTDYQYNNVSFDKEYMIKCVKKYREIEKELK